MAEFKNIEELLSKINIKIEHQNEIEKLRGEKFNIFSILKMETKENATHSAFLGELLNPNGSHFKDNLFLKLFFKVIKNKNLEINKQLDVKTVTVKLEHFIGTNDPDKKTGGRIDIYLKDKNNHTISIENKIYAQDQFAQIERYYNHNKGKNTVYYLTLLGNEPSFESKGYLNLEKNEYKIISYKKHILKWLQLCLKEAAESPILRETIKQYIILIKKLTFTMGNTEEEKRKKEIILQNFEAASYIAANYYNAKNEFCEEIRNEVLHRLNAELKENYSVEKGYFHNKITQILVKPVENIDSNFSFTIEPFNGFDNAELKIGISNPIGFSLHTTEDEEFWRDEETFKDYENYKINFSNPETISKLNKEKNFRDSFIKHIVNEIIAYVVNEENTETLKKLISIVS